MTQANPTLAPPMTEVKRKPRAPRLRPSRLLLYVLLVLLAIMFSFPLIYTALYSLKTSEELFNYPPNLLPIAPQFGNYLRVLSIDRVPVLRWTVNTLIVTILTTLGTVLSCAIVGYSFARFEYRGRGVLFFITLATLTLPAQVTLIPQFVLFYKLGWINTLEPLWVPAWFGGGAFGIFLMRQFFMTIPRDLDEAALIDGAGYLRTFWAVLLPLLKPPLITLAIITFIAAWSDYQNPLIYLNSPEKFTVSVGLQFFVNTPEVGGEPMQNLLMAACVMSMLPPVVAFFLGQKYFVQGVVMSGLKG